MFRINTSDGNTFKLDLNDEEQAKQLIAFLQKRKNQETITGITVLRRYSRRHRCPNAGCKRLAKLICPKCGEIEDGGVFSYMGVQYTIPFPDTFESVNFSVEDLGENTGNGGEKLICQLDDIRLAITAYSKQPAARITLRKTGKQRYNPFER